MTNEENNVLFPKVLHGGTIPSDKSCMCIKKKDDRKTEPWGALTKIFCQKEVCSFKITPLLLSVK